MTSFTREKDQVMSAGWMMEGQYIRNIASGDAGGQQN